MRQAVMHRAAAFGFLETLRLLGGHGGIIQATHLVVYTALCVVVAIIVAWKLSSICRSMGLLLTLTVWVTLFNGVCLLIVLLTYGWQKALYFAISSGKKNAVHYLLLKGADKL